MTPAVADSWLQVRGAWAFGVDGTAWVAEERARPSFTLPIGDRVRLDATIEAKLDEGRDLETEFAALLEGSDYGPLLEQCGCTFPTSDSLVRADLDVARLHVDVYTPAVDVRVGRQAIAWGSAFLVNPTDPFPQVTALAPWSSRAGVDAAKVSASVGAHVDVDAVGALVDDDTAPVAALRGGVHGGAFDAAVSGAWRGAGDEGFVGVDLHGTLGVGAWVEAAEHVSRTADPWLEAAVGVDYTFRVLDGLVLQGQYYHNGAGASDARSEDLGGWLGGTLVGPTCTTDEATADFAVPARSASTPLFAGRDYAQAQGRLTVSEAWWVQALAVLSFTDGSGLVAPEVVWRPGRAWEVATSATLPFQAWGEEGELHPSAGMLDHTSPSPAGGLLHADLDPLVASVTWTTWVRMHF